MMTNNVVDWDCWKIIIQEFYPKSNSNTTKTQPNILNTYLVQIKKCHKDKMYSFKYFFKYDV